MSSPSHHNSRNVRIISIRDRSEAEREMRFIGVSPEGMAIMAQKALFRCLKVHGVSAATANILKQEMLAAGGEAAVAYGCVDCSVAESDVLLMGTVVQYRRLTEKLGRQYASLRELGSEIQRVLDAAQAPRGGSGCARESTWKCRDRLLELGRRTLVMGILNVTPDSFSDGGAYLDVAAAVERASEMASEGADIIDVGGESTRPGSERLSTEDECQRVLPVLERLNNVSVPISLDTSKSGVAEEGLRRGVTIINDITALRGDARMAEVIARSGAGVVLMHMQGAPETMQLNPHYDDVIGEIGEFFEERIEFACRSGIAAEQIVIDPGIGFGKAVEHNLEIIGNLRKIGERVGRPVMIGVSRKSFIGKVLDVPVTERLEGSLAAAAIAVWNGAAVVRVHDVRAARRAVAIVDALKTAKY